MIRLYGVGMKYPGGARALAHVDLQVAAGEFGPLLTWLREHVHRHGRRKLATEIIRDATGREPDSEAFFRYLETKYAKLYDL